MSGNSAFYAAFYDEDGVYHYHDINKKTEFYECTNKHEFRYEGYPVCPEKDYGGLKWV